MVSDIRIGDRVRVTAGMHAGAVGVVVKVHPAAPNAYAVIDSDGERIAAFAGVLEIVTERDIPRTAVVDLLAAAEKRVRQCTYAEMGPNTPLASDELTHIATALRKLLGGEP